MLVVGLAVAKVAVESALLTVDSHSPKAVVSIHTTIESANTVVIVLVSIGAIDIPVINTEADDDKWDAIKISYGQLQKIQMTILKQAGDAMWYETDRYCDARLLNIPNISCDDTHPQKCSVYQKS
uniref:Uncharacterized protein n=1 Tax=Romanomermis culicivorax TaxID=13658 RepID=A0A915L1Q9_ROMCU